MKVGGDLRPSHGYSFRDALPLGEVLGHNQRQVIVAKNADVKDVPIYYDSPLIIRLNAFWIL